MLTGGIGYDVQLPVYVYDSMTGRGVGVGDEFEFELYYHVTERQPKPQLVGFMHGSERHFFEQLIQVTEIEVNDNVLAISTVIDPELLVNILD